MNKKGKRLQSVYANNNLDHHDSASSQNSMKDENSRDISNQEAIEEEKEPSESLNEDDLADFDDEIIDEAKPNNFKMDENRAYRVHRNYDLLKGNLFKPLFFDIKWKDLYSHRSPQNAREKKLVVGNQLDPIVKIYERVIFKDQPFILKMS